MNTEQFFASAIPYIVAILFALIFVVLLRFLRSRIGLPSLPLAAGIAVVLLLAIPQVAPGLAPPSTALALTIGIAFLCVQPKPSSTPVLLRAIALVTGLEGSMAVLKSSPLPAAVALGVAGTMLYLSDRAADG